MGRGQSMNICNEPMRNKFIIKVVSIQKETHRSEESDVRILIPPEKNRQGRPEHPCLIQMLQ